MCQQCGSPTNNTSVIFWCTNEGCMGLSARTLWHTCKSSPDVKGRPELDLLTASSIQFTGSTVTELDDFSKLIVLKMISRSIFYKIQTTYLYSAIEDLHTPQRQQILAKLFPEQNQDPNENEKHLLLAPKFAHLSGDGRALI